MTATDIDSVARIRRREAPALAAEEYGLWMQRIDVCRATNRSPQLTAGHDGRLVADVVREWADRHGEPFTLRLTGTAGSTFQRAGRGRELELDAVEFCRTLSGRSPGDGLLATQVVF